MALLNLREVFGRLLRHGGKSVARHIVQQGTGDTVVQVAGDAGAVVTGDVHIHTGDAHDALAELEPNPSESPGDRAYREHAMLVSATGETNRP